MDHNQRTPRDRRAGASSLRQTTKNRATDLGALNERENEASRHENPSRDPPLAEILGQGNVIWVVVNDRQLAIFDTL